MLLSPKIIVFDDDPTGSQTLWGCPLLLRWDAETLAWGLAQPSPFLFLITNSRALDPTAATERLRQICGALKPALAAAQAAGSIDRWWLVSRGDSTLRGHFPLEVDVINAELGPFDATFLAPAFLPGGRTTVAGQHLLSGRPVHESAFASDGLFGYSTSYLPAWVEQKTAGRIGADQVERLDLAALELGGEPLRQRLAGFQGNCCVAVDAERPQQLAALGAAVRELTAPAAAERWGRPRRFLFQAAASLLNGLAPLPPQPLAGAGLVGLRRSGAQGLLPGLVLVGSHVPLADAQLECLLAEPRCGGVELEVAQLAELLARVEGDSDSGQGRLAALEQGYLLALRRQLAAGRTPVLFSSRGEYQCASAAERRHLGLALAALMARLAGALAPELGYLISKGGITSHTLLATGLNRAAVALQGQLLPGLSLVLAGDLPVVTFPGNLGNAQGLRQAWVLWEGEAVSGGRQFS